MVLKGIDISEHNGDINLSTYDHDYVIIRAGYDVKEDRWFQANCMKCERAKIPYGVYWYSYALNQKSALEEAKACLKTIEGKKISCGVWFDMEDADGYKRKHGWQMDRSNVSAICNAFCDELQKAGYYTGIYASLSWLTGSGQVIDCPKYDKWVAHWSDPIKEHEDIGTVLQYADKPLDMDLIYADSLERYDMSVEKKYNLCFGMKVFNVTQLPGGSYSHPNMALDCSGSDSGIDFWFAQGNWKCTAGPWGNGTYFFVSCDKKGNPTKVHCADGKERIITLALTHSEQKYIETTVGKVYYDGDPMYEEGMKGGNCTGNHIHLEIAEGIQTTKTYDSAMKVYRMKNELNPVELMYINDSFTTVKQTLGVTFRHCATAEYKALNGWKRSNKKWYYYIDDVPVTGWKKLSWSKGKNWFYFNEDGVMQTGFKYLPYKNAYDWYYLDDSSGAMTTGEVPITCKFNRSGALTGGTRT